LKPVKSPWAVLGKSNFANINIEQLADKVILCLDNDGSKIVTDKKIHEAVEQLQSHGKQVRIIIPETAYKRIKSFFFGFHLLASYTANSMSWP